MIRLYLSFYFLLSVNVKPEVVVLFPFIPWKYDSYNECIKPWANMEAGW